MRQKITAVFLAAVLLYSLSGCHKIDGGASEVPSELSSSSSQESVPEDILSPEEELLSTMTLSEKVGQMFFLAYRKNDDGSNMLVLSEAAKEQLRTIQPGGFCLFGENVGSVEQLRAMISDAKGSVRLPLFVSVDQEGGSVQRISHSEAIPATNLPPMWKVGSTGDPVLARRVGGVLGSELAVFGFNMDFAPVCDVFSNPNNTVIGQRSFSSDPTVVAEMSLELAKGLSDAGIIPAAKHFPGHGDTDADTHIGYAISNKTRKELEQTELIPFRAQIEAGVPLLMVAHISLPALNGDNTPATLSEQVVTGLLRNELGYENIIITDAMNMGAIVENYGGNDACVRAVQAGADMLLMPQDPPGAYQAILEAVHSGVLTEERIDESVLRILRVKYQYRLFDPPPLSDPALLGCAEHQAVADAVQAKQ